MKVSNSQKTKQYELTPRERRTLRSFLAAIDVEKLNVYRANVALEEAQAAVRAALAKVDSATDRYHAAVAFLAQSQGMARWQLAPDGARLEGQSNDNETKKED